jgi:hypothetical protein
MGKGAQKGPDKGNEDKDRKDDQKEVDTHPIQPALPLIVGRWARRLRRGNWFTSDRHL